MPTDPIASGHPAVAATPTDATRGRLRKSPAAFRTISEVADELHIPQHVLRFWETRFPQVKPLKRGGGRRYYRPDDITLLRSISHLLYVQGYTIKGVQRLLREGDGALGDDIPPASASERSDAEAERDLLSSVAQDSPAAVSDLVGSAQTVDSVFLRELLKELEHIRDLLPAS